MKHTKELKGKELEEFLKNRFPNWKKGTSIFDETIFSDINKNN